MKTLKDLSGPVFIGRNIITFEIFTALGLAQIFRLLIIFGIGQFLASTLSYLAPSISVDKLKPRA